jgi:hypothetical protein
VDAPAGLSEQAAAGAVTQAMTAVPGRGHAPLLREADIYILSGDLGVGYDLAGRRLVSWGDQHANTQDLQLRVLPSGIVGRNGCFQAVAAEQAGDQFCFGAAGDDSHSHVARVHYRLSLVRWPDRTRTTIVPRPARRARGTPWPKPWDRSTLGSLDVDTLTGEA